jgi:hypothetical protein
MLKPVPQVQVYPSIQITQDRNVGVGQDYRIKALFDLLGGETLIFFQVT